MVKRISILTVMFLFQQFLFASPVLATRHHKTTLKQVRQAVHAEAPYVERIKCSREGRRFYCSAQMEI